MYIQFLGTSSGTPTKNRNVTAIALQASKGKAWYLIDCGEATQHQLLHTRLSLHSLAGIFITHIHGDHCYGLPGLLGSAGMTGRTAPLTIVAPEGIREWLEATLTYTQMHLPFELNFMLADDVLEGDQPDIVFGQFRLGLTRLAHRVPSYAYSFTETWVDGLLDTEKLEAEGIPRGELWGRINAGEDVEYQGRCLQAQDYIKTADAPRKLVIAGDNAEPDLLASECADSSLLVHEATYAETMAQQASEFGHSYAAQVAAFARRCQLPNLLLTHFSPRYQLHPQAASSVDLLRQEALREYSGNLFLAEDFQRYQLDKQGVLSLCNS